MIISASRRTDIPAWYSEWFFNRLSDGYVNIRNPYNKNMVSKVSLLTNQVDCFVFWTKNPAPFIKYIPALASYMFYVQFTVNPYDLIIEPNIPSKDRILNTFKILSDCIGKNRVIWRYDPILLTQDIAIEFHIKQFEILATYLSPYTNTCVISFIDAYKKTEKRMLKIGARQLTNDEIMTLAPQLKQIANSHNLKLQTCCESIDLHFFGIEHGSCIDKQLIEKLTGLNLNVKKDPHQRKVCNCVESVDIGEYNSCGHHCLYCYANADLLYVNNRILLHNPLSSLLIGELSANDCVVERRFS